MGVGIQANLWTRHWIRGHCDWFQGIPPLTCSRKNDKYIAFAIDKGVYCQTLRRVYNCTVANYCQKDESLLSIFVICCSLLVISQIGIQTQLIGPAFILVCHQPKCIFKCELSRKSVWSHAVNLISLLTPTALRTKPSPTAISEQYSVRL